MCGTALPARRPRPRPEGVTDGAGPLLDWLEIPRRHVREPQDDLQGLVLLDLPDHDSTEMAHRLEVDRLVALVDVLVWVLDPQKYADAAVHDRYLRPLARHGDVMVVVLNQVDRLAAADVPDAVADVRRLLADDGLRDVPVLPVSATAGTGLDRLRDVLTGAVTAHRAALRRIAADLDTVSAGLADVVGGPARDDVDSGAQRALVAALAAAAGIPAVGAAVQRAAVHRAVTTHGLPVHPLVCAACGRTRCAGCTSTGPARRPSPPGPTTPTSCRLRSGRPCPPPAPWSGPGWTWRCAASPTTPPRACPTRGRTRCATPPGHARATWPTRWTGPSRPRTSGWRATVLVARRRPAAGAARGDGRGGRAVAGRALRAHGAAAARPEPPQVGIVPLPTVLLIGGLLAGVLLALLARALAADRRPAPPGTGGGPAARVGGRGGGEPGAGAGARGAGGVLGPPGRGGGSAPVTLLIPDHS